MISDIPEIIHVEYSAYSLGIGGEIPITEITNGFIKGEVQVRNSARTPKPFAVVMALYDGYNTLCDVRTLESNVNAFSNTKVICGFNVPDDYNHYRIVLSVWDNLTDMNNLAEDFVIN